jgi:hypothetical protein
MDIDDLRKFVLYMDSDGNNTSRVKIDSTSFPYTIKTFINDTIPHYNDNDSPLVDFIDEIDMLFISNGLDITIVNEFPEPFNKPPTIDVPTVELVVVPTTTTTVATIIEDNSIYTSGKSIYILLTSTSCPPTSCPPTIVDNNNTNGMRELHRAYKEVYTGKTPVYSDYNNFSNVIKAQKINKQTLNNFIKYLRQTDDAIISTRGTKDYGIIKILIHKYGSDFKLWKNLPRKDCETNFGLPILKKIRSIVCGSYHQADHNTKTPLCNDIFLCTKPTY